MHVKILKGLGALVLLGAAVVGLPLLFIGIGANPLPGLAQLPDVIGRPDYGGQFFLTTIFPLIGWIAWAWFTISVLIEIPAALTGVKAPKIPAFGAGQGMASILVAAVLAMGAGTPALASTADNGESTSISQTNTVADADAADAAAKPTKAQDKTQAYTVKSGDSLWSIAEQFLGDGEKYHQIAELNYGNVQDDGQALTKDHFLATGWTLQVPVTSQAASSTTYTVQTGDSLSGIAQEKLGDEADYTRILEANPSITTPDLIHPGDSITIPGHAAAQDAKQAPQKEASRPSAQTKPTAEKSAPKKAAPKPETTKKEQPAADEKGMSPGQAALTPAPQEAPKEAAAPEQVDDAADSVDETGELSLLQTAGGIGALLAAGLIGLLGRRRFNQRRRRKAGEEVPTAQGEPAAMEQKLREVQDPLTATQIDTALRYVASWAQEAEVGLPEMFCARATDQTLVLYLAASADLPEPFNAVDDEQTVWEVDPGDIPDLEVSPAAPYPALVTLGQDGHGAHLLADLEYIGALGVVDATGNSSEILNALAVELGMSPWSEELQVSLVGVAAGLPEAIGGGRIRHFEDIDALLVRLRGKARETRRVLDEVEAESLHELRTRTGVEPVQPEIVILGERPTAEQIDMLTELIEELPRVGVAAVTADHSLSDWTLNVDVENQGNLEPLGAPLKPQRVTKTEHQAIVDLLATASEAPATVTAKDEITLETIDASGALSVVSEPDLSDAGQSAGQAVAEDDAWAVSEEALDEGPAAAQDAEETEHEPAQSASEPTEVLQTAAESEPDQEPAIKATEPTEEEQAPATTTDAEEETSSDPQETEQPASAWDVPVAGGEVEEPGEELPVAGEVGQLLEGAEVDAQRDAPIIRVLGTVDTLGARGVMPTTPAGDVSAVKIARRTAVGAFLALHPGATLEEFHQAFWPNADPKSAKSETSRNRLSSDVRQFFGQDEEGDFYYPHTTNGVYRMDPRVQTDWDIFMQLVGNSVSTCSTERLVGALRLVRGAPFDGVSAKNYLWNEMMRSRMIDAICDTAHELVRRSTNAGNPALARLGARVGRMVDPANEQMWRNGLLAEHSAKNRVGVEEIAKRLHDYLDSFGEDYEPEEETQDLLKQLRKRHGYQVAG